MTEDTNISDEISKLKTNITKLEDIVSKATTIKENKKNLLKKAKEDKLIPKSDIERFSDDIGNFDKITADKTLIKKAKTKLIQLELEMALSEYTSLQDEYTQTYKEIENQVKSEQDEKS
jgi:hypothetical protein